MRIEVRLFALYREQAGTDRLALELPEGARVREAQKALEERFPGLRLEGGMAAVNQALAGAETPLKEGDEVAFLPPVSGGQDSYGLTQEPLDLEALVAWATAPEYGAVVSFLGTTRSPNRGEEVAFLEYEAYPELAEQVMAGLIDAGYTGRLSRINSSDSFIPLGPAANTVLLDEELIYAAALTLASR